MQRKYFCGALLLLVGALTACSKTEPPVKTTVNETQEVVIENQNIFIDANNADTKEREVLTSKDKKYTYCVNGIEGYTILSDNTTTSLTYEVPSEIDGIKITKIGKTAYANKNFTRVVIPDSIKIIDEAAFADCHNLIEVTTGKDCVEIKESAFQNCYKLNKVNLNQGMFRLGKSAFSACYKLTEINLPDSIQMIDSYCFTNSGLKTITLPPLLKSVSDGVFMGCSDLATVTQTGTIYSYGDSAFKDCVSLSITVDDKCEKAVINAFENVKEVNIDEGIYVSPEGLKYDGDFSEFEDGDLIKRYYEELK